MFFTQVCIRSLLLSVQRSHTLRVWSMLQSRQGNRKRTAGVERWQGNRKRTAGVEHGYASSSGRGGPASSSARETQPCQRTRTRSPRQSHTEIVTDHVDRIDQELENLRRHLQLVRTCVIEGPQL